MDYMVEKCGYTSGDLQISRLSQPEDDWQVNTLAGNSPIAFGKLTGATLGSIWIGMSLNHSLKKTLDTSVEHWNVSQKLSAPHRIQTTGAPMLLFVCRCRRCCLKACNIFVAHYRQNLYLFLGETEEMWRTDKKSKKGESSLPKRKLNAERKVAIHRTRLKSAEDTSLNAHNYLFLQVCFL